MPFEYAIVPEGDEEKSPTGYVMREVHGIFRYDYDGSFEMIVLQPVNDKEAEVFILPDAVIDAERQAFSKALLNDESKVAAVTPETPFETYFQNEDGSRGRLYIDYLPLGSRVLYLADGQVKFVNDDFVK